MTKFLAKPLGSTWYRACTGLLGAGLTLLAPAAVVGQTQTPQYGTAPQEVAYPGPMPPSEKAEGTFGPLKIRLYGTLLLNIAVSDSRVDGQDIPLWASQDSVLVPLPDGSTRRAGELHDLVFSARQSVLGFTLSRANQTASGWNPSAALELDFFGSRPVDIRLSQARVFNEPRLRLAYLQLERGMWKIVAGQDNVILAPLDPVSLSHVAVPLGATAGNLWGRLPQVRLDHTHKFGETSALFQFGILRPVFGDPALSDLPAAGTAVDNNPGFGERSTHPFYQARVALSRPMMGSTATVGVAGHYGKENVGNGRNLDSWAFAFDLNLPLLSRLILRGEGFVGSNLVSFQGGVLQGVAAVSVAGPPARLDPIQRIGTGGGWVELVVPVTLDNKNIFYAGAGTDDPRDKHLLPAAVPRAKNSFVWASLFRKLTDEVTLAFEWSNWQFRTEAFAGGRPGPRGPYGSANVFNLALAYQF